MEQDLSVARVQACADDLVVDGFDDMEAELHLQDLLVRICCRDGRCGNLG